MGMPQVKASRGKGVGSQDDDSRLRGEHGTCNLLKSIVYVDVRLPPPPRCTVRVVSSLVSAPQPRSASAASRTFWLATSARSLSSWLKATLPSKSKDDLSDMHIYPMGLVPACMRGGGAKSQARRATHRMMAVSSCARWFTPSFCMAAKVSPKASASEILGIEMHWD